MGSRKQQTKKEWWDNFKNKEEEGNRKKMCEIHERNTNSMFFISIHLLNEIDQKHKTSTSHNKLHMQMFISIAVSYKLEGWVKRDKRKKAGKKEENKKRERCCNNSRASGDGEESVLTKKRHETCVCMCISPHSLFRPLACHFWEMWGEWNGAKGEKKKGVVSSKSIEKRERRE